MKKYTRKFITAMLVLAMSVSLVACGEKETTEEVVVDTVGIEIKQNDYRGGLVRVQQLQNNVVKTMEGMKANNVVLRQDSPNSFWTAEGYQDFVSTLFDTAIINDTQWFNEEETDWTTILNQAMITPSSYSDGAKFFTGVSMLRNEKDDYSIIGVPYSLNLSLKEKNYNYGNKANYRVLYDCDKDCGKAYATMSIDNTLPAVTTEMFEYQRIDDNTFVIQTSRERMMIILAPAENDTDIREREITEFYYSKLVLDGYRTTFEPYEPLPEANPDTNIVSKENIKKNELMASMPVINDKGDISSRYGEKESMFFLEPKAINRDWVYEDKALQQSISYKNGVLVVTTYNKLTEKYERFIYSRVDADKKISDELETLVEIEGLVGVQRVDDVPDEIVTSTTETTSENVSETAETTSDGVTTDVSNVDETGETSTSDTINEPVSETETTEEVAEEQEETETDTE